MLIKVDELEVPVIHTSLALSTRFMAFLNTR